MSSSEIDKQIAEVFGTTVQTERNRSISSSSSGSGTSGSSSDSSTSSESIVSKSSPNIQESKLVKPDSTSSSASNSPKSNDKKNKQVLSSSDSEDFGTTLVNKLGALADSIISSTTDEPKLTGQNNTNTSPIHQTPSIDQPLGAPIIEIVPNPSKDATISSKGSIKINDKSSMVIGYTTS